MAAGLAFAKARISESIDGALTELVADAAVSTRSRSLLAVGQSGRVLLSVPDVASVVQETPLVWRVEADGRTFLVERKRRKG